MNLITHLTGLWRRRSRSKPATKQDLIEMEGRIIMKQSEVVAQLNKALGEIRGKIDELQTAVKNQDNASPELVAIAQQLDDIVPDAPTEPAPEPSPTTETSTANG